MFYKHKDDKALPSRKHDMYERYKETRHRRSLDDVTNTTSSNTPSNITSNITSNIDSEGEDSNEDEPLPYIAKRRTNKARKTATVTHQESVSAAENDESSDEFVMCDSESSDDDDDSLDFFPKLSGADDKYCRPK
jgi:hypothetical protein